MDGPKGDYCTCIALVIINLLFQITPTSKWNGIFKKWLFKLLISKMIFSLLSQSINVLQNKFVPWAPPSPIN
jgi:hypothetical protein